MQRRPPSIRFQLLLAVNTTLAIALSLFLAFDYWDELSTRLWDKHVMLQDQARALCPAVYRVYRTTLELNPGYAPGSSASRPLIRGRGPDPIEATLDAISRKVRQREKDGPYVAVRIEGRFVTSGGDPTLAEQVVPFIEEATKARQYRVEAHGREIVFARDKVENVEVYVWTSGSDILAAAKQDMLWRIMALGCLGLGITAIVNIILLRLVNRPLHNLVTAVRRIGRGELGVQAEGGQSAETRYLADEINTMSLSLADADRIRKAQMDKAQRVQHRLRPSPEAVAKWRVSYHQRSANEVGGDYLDVQWQADGWLVLCVADVTGHGVPAAMGAAMLKTLVDSASAKTREPSEILTQVNRGFTSVSLEEDFASMVVACLNPERTRLVYASAGHEPGYLLTPMAAAKEGDPTSQAGAALIESSGPLIGILESSTWETHELPLAPGQKIVLVTDGLAETMSTTGKSVGRKRLKEWMIGFAGLPGVAVCEALARKADEFRKTSTLQDDVTILVCEV